MVERMEEAGEITVIRPQKPVMVDRIERDIRKLTDLYEEGYACAAKYDFQWLILFILNLCRTTNFRRSDIICRK